MEGATETRQTRGASANLGSSPRTQRVAEVTRCKSGLAGRINSAAHSASRADKIKKGKDGGTDKASQL